MKVLQCGPSEYERMLDQLQFMRDKGQEDLLTIAAIVVEGLHEKAQTRVNGPSVSDTSDIRKPLLPLPLNPKDPQT